MARATGYKVTLTGWLTFDKKDIDSQHAALTVLRAAKEKPAELAAKLTGVQVEARQSSYDPGEAAEVKKTVAAQASAAPSAARPGK